MLGMATSIRRGSDSTISPELAWEEDERATAHVVIRGWGENLAHVCVARIATQLCAFWRSTRPFYHLAAPVALETCCNVLPRVTPAIPTFGWDDAQLPLMMLVMRVMLVLVVLVMHVQWLMLMMLLMLLMLMMLNCC